MNYENTKGLAASQAVEQRLGPDKPQASHYQVKQVEGIVADLIDLVRRMPSDYRLGAPERSLLHHEAMRAAQRAAIAQLFDAFGFGTSTR